MPQLVIAVEILYQPHEHKSHMAFIQQLFYRLIEFEDTRLCFLLFI